MSGLAKATLVPLKAGDKPDGDPIPVQFNPASLKVQLSNQNDTGRSQGRQDQQYLGSSSMQLSFDLEFDTADESKGGAARSVREKTALVEQFVLPKVEGKKKSAPPRVRFSWGGLVVDGVINGLTIDLDLFSADGIPLHAKMNVSIKEQRGEYRHLAVGSGANTGPTSTNNGTAGSPTAADRTGTAIGGESAAEFAARMGLDPAAWRDLAAGFENPLSLPAGASIDFSSALSLSAGVGLSAGIEAGASVSLEAAFGLDVRAGASATFGASFDAEVSAGLALTAAGGVAGAIEQVQILRSAAGAASARRDFDTAAPAPATRATAGGQPVVAPAIGIASLPPTTGAAVERATSGPDRLIARPIPVDQRRTPLRLTGLPSAQTQASAPAAPLPPAADRRATTFGLGVPLRPRAGGAVALRTAAVAGHVPLQARAADPLGTDDPAAPPWARLRSGDPVRTRVEARRRPRPCGCAHVCHHRTGTGR